MSASGYEQDWAKRDGVTIKHWAAPKEVLAEGGQVPRHALRRTRARTDGKLVETGETFAIAGRHGVQGHRPELRWPAPAGAAHRAARTAASSPTPTAAHRSPRSGRAATAPTAGATSRWTRSSTASAPRISADRTLRGQGDRSMADLTTNFAGIKSPNPFWLASAPPTNTAYQVDARLRRRLGRRGVEDDRRARSSTSCSRYGAVDLGTDQRMMGFNNIELITDRPLEDEPARDRARSRSAARTRA